MALIGEYPVSQSTMLTAIAHHPDSPFGMLFLGMTASDPELPTPLAKKLTTQTNDETSNDGRSKLDPIYDEDEDDDSVRSGHRHYW